MPTLPAPPLQKPSAFAATGAEFGCLEAVLGQLGGGRDFPQIRTCVLYDCLLNTETVSPLHSFGPLIEARRHAFVIITSD